MDSTNLFGIPIPSTDPLFVATVIVHIAVALVALAAGLVGMLSDKSKARHPKAGRIYYRAMAGSYVLIVLLSLMRWPHNINLLLIGTVSFGCAHLGRTITRTKPERWPRKHTMLMGMSYVFLLTGFYVDNGKNLPVWNLLPPWSFYFIPSFIGIPIIIRALATHPLNNR